MIERLESLIGSTEIQDFERSLTSRPPKSIRPRVDRGNLCLPFETRPVAWFPQGLEVVDSSIRPGGFLEYAVADYYIQDSGSMLPLAMLDLQPDDWVCDLCAAPGGKATAIAETLGPDGFLLANEVIASRLDVLRYALSRTGRANYCVSNLDPELLAQCLAGRFDKVLVDVPCSGQSLLGRQRQTESSFSSNHVQHCAARAKRILDQALRLVRPGGRLILSTCTFAIEENEAQIESILETYCQSVSIIPFESLQAWQSPLRHGCYRLWPHRDRCAGGFAAALSITDPIHPILAPQDHSKTRTRKTKLKHEKTSKSINLQKDNSQDDLQRLGSFGIRITQEPPLWFGHEQGAARFLEEFSHRIGHGLRIAQSIKGRLEPYHGLAMLCSGLFTADQSVELDDPTAERFLLGQSIQRIESNMDGAALRSVWSLAQWKNKPLGWLKSANGRWNNYLPTWARFTSFATKSAWTSDDQPHG